ncbi:aquaporin Z [Nakamurella lactea]|uniref:aquaporin Z n=1 Tax=Nakamurella lactea TaxID=459515 RepID=UPI00048C462F|nr:aquaporin Z [Nakamurella lactea]
MNSPTTAQRLAAEALGTFVLVFGGCGAAVLAANFPGGDDKTNPLGIGFLGVALAFGLTVLVMAYAVGHISGGHFNPAVTLGAAAAGRLPWKDTIGYIITQVVAAIAAAGVLYAIASGRDGFNTDGPNAFATNGFGDNSPGGYPLLSALLVEVVLTAIFLFVILGTTDSRAPKGFAPLAIGLSLTLIHLVAIPVTNTSVNPARSIGPAVFVGGTSLAQIWLFILAPIAGALIAGFTYRALLGEGPVNSFEAADTI